MKNIIIFLALMVFVICAFTPEQIEEYKKRIKVRDKYVSECILNDNSTSPEIRKKLEENKDKGLIKVLPISKKLNETDRKIVRRCKEEYMKILEEEITRKLNSATDDNL